jgi:hypothetical protein
MAGTPVRNPLRLIGKPIGMNAEALDQAAEVTPIDVALARAVWYQNAPARFATLLDGPPEDHLGAS